ncbi:hypothetical protein LTR02_002068 [Friedmanniomyces endolithicus]|nr:hypothetical protein LTR02_002068 [Friedmanniomyces endolithicus]
MGLMDKILHPGSKDQAASQGDQPLYSDSERQRIEQQGNIQNPNTSSSGQPMGDSTGDRSHGLRHPVQSAAGRANEGQYAQAGSYGSGSTNLDPNNDGYGSSGRQKLQAQDPVDPRSIRGQNAIYDNSDRADKHNFLHRDHQGSGKANDQDLSNQMGRTSLENRDAIPTAGGEKLGGLGSNTDRERYPSQPHHYGRDAALGAGAIGVGEHERRKHHDGEMMSGGLGSGNEREREREQQQHHYGRDAALAGGAGAGAIGLEEHERRKHAGGERMGGLGSSNEQERLQGQQQPQHHYGRDAALAGGAGAGALGLEEHERRKHADRERMGGLGSGDERRHGQNLSSDAAVLHGGQDVPPNAYYEALKDKDTGHMVNSTGQGGSSSQPDHHYGRDAALAGGAGAGALGLEEHERRKHAGGNNMGGLGSGNDQGLQQSGQQQHHYGRDAGLVGGAGAGVIGIEEYERRNKHTGGENTGGLGSGSRNEPYDSQKQHHYGRDAALAGGALGVGEHEHRKHERQGQSGMNDQYGQDSSSYPSNSGRHADEVMGATGAGAAGHGLFHHGKGHSGEGEQGLNKPLPGVGSEAGSGVSIEKRLGAAYEAGYRDAMAHVEAERQRGFSVA